MPEKLTLTQKFASFLNRLEHFIKHTEDYGLEVTRISEPVETIHGIEASIWIKWNPNEKEETS